jgi:hypothetical protein
VESPKPFGFHASARNRPSPTLVEEDRTIYPNVHDVQHTFGVSWQQLVQIEPELENLLERVRLAPSGGRAFSDLHEVFDPLRDELASLIGFAGKHHNHPVLGSAGAYEVAYWTLYNAVARLLTGRAANTPGVSATEQEATRLGFHSCK